ncbi:orotidine-5'-phosphate decarboxylase [Microbacterium sp. LRZ72]|uniref:orotidine-5'-phosphate decarboxylase n=1 Tax=Microbacterium sp. LRZ72 TaxID=2942481 RepID=UPI0029A7B04D|nr:orotidine-5'-phosphate decarboxylase [Microbacterium sp. LRZ72]MDX2375392.1 orotidine-5'-phosphate decarboxylase [Microbacterium sp. LRZ72]
MTNDPVAFGARLRAAIGERGRLCVGIDPHEALLTRWDMSVSAASAREFGLRVVSACAGRVAVVKPQVAFYERFGSAGFSALEDVLAAAREAGLLVLADAKRGDIGSTMSAYARGWFAPGSPLEVDALTLNPYLGVGALRDSLEVAVSHGKGAFVLAATSNPEATAVQQARVAADAVAPPQTVAARVAHEVTAFNAGSTPRGEWGSVGLVIGATVDRDAAGLADVGEPVTPVLAPGFGHQGARAEDVDRILGAFAPAALVSESRSILVAGPEGIVDAIDDACRRAGGRRG